MNSTDSNTDKIEGVLALQTLAMPKDTNANGDIFGGWLVSQMDLAAGIISKEISRGRSVTVAIQNVTFIKPVSVGATVTCYCQETRRGRTSLHIAVDVWSSHHAIGEKAFKVAAGTFVFVAIDDKGKPRPIPA
jgi:acyl-CoA thioesterase YciA